MAIDEAAPAGKNPMKRLFEDDDDDDEEGANAFGSGAAGKAASFTINEEYARRYEHNKKREEKQKLEEKYGKAADDVDDDESSSDEGTEDEDGYLLTEDLDARMSAALQAIKNKDPRVYNADAKFFDAAEAEKAGEEAAAASARDPKEKPIYLQDYHRERYLRGDVGADDDSDDDNTNGPGGASLTKTYQQEQDALKKALVDSMNAADGGPASDNDDDADDADAFIKPKASTKAAKESAAASGVHPSRVGHIKKITKVDVENADKDPALFLSNFVSSRAWVPDDETTGPGWEAFDSEEEEENNRERAEAFETAYNLRFEDPNKSNEVLKSYSRTVVSERSVRREEKTARQRQREQERERQEAEKQARREERARLRRLNIEEAQEKLAKIKQAAGVAGRDLAEDEWMGLLDDAWDNDAWESKMRKHFGDDYYAEKDASLEDELEADGDDADSNGKKKGKKSSKKNRPKKPKWDDDIDIKDLIPDFEDEALPNIALSDDDNENDEEEVGDDDKDDEDDEEGHSSKRRKTGKALKKDRADAKREARRERARIEALVDRQMALDDPTALAAAGPATGVNAELGGRFRYRETSPQTFGLTARDILLAPSDAALNEFAGLKKLATFRDEERKRKDRKKLGKKARLRQWRRDTFGADYEHSGPTFGFERFVDEAAEAEASGHKKRKSKHQEEGGDSDADKPKKKKKRSRKNKGKGKASDE
ncbi:protein KRI1 [Sporothrix brasiliensis 5110]|uniref:Protein KRI1 n=1 Tax=Sporothrix brasiliensis 5110 TaxID=1398154 RepID=A0A0C2EZ88_9PEZI|nr:protein KRI1 [Sporothrix brasiliensis 5110]KIH91819.1 protein KRI1 [Sporothrix brasiliensis 5110]